MSTALDPSVPENKESRVVRHGLKVLKSIDFLRAAALPIAAVAALVAPPTFPFVAGIAAIALGAAGVLATREKKQLTKAIESNKQTLSQEKIDEILSTVNSTSVAGPS